MELEMVEAFAINTNHTALADKSCRVHLIYNMENLCRFFKLFDACASCERGENMLFFKKQGWPTAGERGQAFEKTNSIRRYSVVHHLLLRAAVGGDARALPRRSRHSLLL